MKKITLGILLSICVAFAQNSGYKDISSQEAYNMQQKGAVLIDVRTKNEYEQLHPKNAVNIPVFANLGRLDNSSINKNFANEVLLAVGNDKNKEIIVICRSGTRSKIAVNNLIENGFTNIHNIPQGVAFGWFKTNLPTEK